MFDKFLDAQLIDNKQITNNLPNGRFVRDNGFLPGSFNFSEFGLNFARQNDDQMMSIGVGE